MRARGLVACLAATGAVALLAVVVAAAPPATPEVMKQGRAVYEPTCAACHGLSGEGNGPVAFALRPPPRNFTKDVFKAGDSVDQIFATVTNGLPGTSMVGYPMLAEADRRALAYYVRSFRPGK